MIVNNQTTELQNILNLCYPIDTNSASDAAMLVERLIDMITQYIDLFQLVSKFLCKRSTKLNFKFIFSFHGVQNFCHDISSTTLTPLESLIRWARFVYETETGCFDFGYKNAVDRYSNTRQPRNHYNVSKPIADLRKIGFSLRNGMALFSMHADRTFQSGRPV